ncbi:Uma2 family endonuclease [Streptomyces oceani]|uniref:Putative restriction endonuclease domain-containing protein n=1 Tax=Streptomyces oceani TaxID=1075402 RepID=A0A1E7JYX1_9ACTN|nr:Uma2 family endonuclease [Streptomyces oceani]OEU96874.1 hypothetical protein AN216_18110 [Streptomyces oceani]
MTVELTDRIEMAENSGTNLDELFELLERMPVPEGFKAEIVEGTVHMSPQRDAHWEIIAAVYDALRTRYPRNRLKSDVRLDFPGEANGFAPDVLALRSEAVPRADGRRGWHYQDVEFVAEVISRGTAANDYGPKLRAYAVAEVPVYLIVDPYTASCQLHTHPKQGEYQSQLIAKFGEVIDLSDTIAGITLPTEDFPVERDG